MIDSRIVMNKQKIELAIKTNKYILFDYVKKDLEITRNRLVDPDRLEGSKDDFPARVVGYDINKNAPRIFELEGIMDLQIVEQDYALNQKTN